MRSKLIISLAATGLLLALLLLAGNLLVPRLLSGPCGKDCLLRVSTARLGFTGATFGGVNFRHGDSANEEWRAEADRVAISVNWFRWLDGRPEIRSLRLEKPRITLSQGEAEKPPKAPSPTPRLRVQAVAIRGGSFTFVEKSGGRTGRLRFDEIDADAGLLTSAEPDRPTDVRLRARLEESGRVDIAVRARFFHPNPDVSLAVYVYEQPLAKVNEYFTPSNSFRLQGELTRAEAHVEATQRKLNARAKLLFSGLDVKFTREDHSPIGAFFRGLLADLKLRESNHEDPEGESRVSLEREADESIISFLLRGLKEAALHRASS